MNLGQLHTEDCPYKCRNGVLAVGHNKLVTPAAFPRTATAIRCLKLGPRTTYGEARTYWSLDNLGITFVDFAIDPLIDMLALLEPSLNM